MVAQFWLMKRNGEGIGVIYLRVKNQKDEEEGTWTFLEDFVRKQIFETCLPHSIFAQVRIFHLLKMEDKVTSEMSINLIAPTNFVPSQTFWCDRATSSSSHSTFAELDRLRGTRPPSWSFAKCQTWVMFLQLWAIPGLFGRSILHWGMPGPQSAIKIAQVYPFAVFVGVFTQFFKSNHLDT